MYEQFFGFTTRPFISTPHVQSYFPGESIHHALSNTRMCVERASGPVVVTGITGSGKSLLLAMLATHFQNTYTVVNVICGSMRERRDLLQSILFELNLPYRDMSEGELRLSLIDYLKTDVVNTNGLLVLADDAHDLTTDMLDELQVITNLVRDGRPLVSLVMVGLPSLEDHLIDTKSESFNQRIAARCYLNTFVQNETFEYISTHLERAGGNGDHLFTGDAMKSVHQSSDGCPRIINQICDYALVLAASQGSQRVTAEIVQDAWRDVQSLPGSAPAIPTIPSQPIQQQPETTSFVSEPSSVISEQQTDSDLMVIEFGQLTDDDDLDTGSSIELSAVNSSLDDGIVNSEPTVSEQTDYDDVADLVQASTTQPFAGSPAMELTDVDYNRSTADDDQGRVSGFSDPFRDESFDEEEVVKASFIPEVSEQNLNSLMLSTDQLRCLESLELESSCVAESNVQTATTESIDTTAAIQEDESDYETDVEVDDHEDLKLSHDGLESLGQIAENIKQLQRDMRFSEQQFHSQAAHPDFQAIADDQPIEELMQEFSTVENSESDPFAEQSTIPLPHVTTEATTVEDDQDILISPAEPTDRFPTEEPVEAYGETEQVSTGNAERMDYVELFQQLRNG